MYLTVTDKNNFGLIFHHHEGSKFGHANIPLATIEGSPLAVGGLTRHPSIDYTNKVEKLDISANFWTEVDAYPYME